MLAFSNGVDCGNFDASVLSGVHGSESHGSVPVPRSGDVDEVEIITLAEIFEVVVALCVNFGALLARFFDKVLSMDRFFFYEVTDGVDLNMGNTEKVFEHAGATASSADDAEADGVALFELDANHSFGCRSGRGDGTFRRENFRVRGNGGTEETDSGFEKLAAG